MFERLKERGFEIEFRSHAEAILSVDFPEVAKQLEDVLLTSTIPIEEIIGSGGGETKGTQRLRNALAGLNWRKHNFIVQRIIDGVEREAQSHEIDHVKTFDAGTIALEIEWNNKDPFFDRDLENFKRLHADGGISLGIIVTRGATLQDSIRDLIRRFADYQNINSHEDMERLGLNPTRRQVREVMKRVARKKILSHFVTLGLISSSRTNSGWQQLTGANCRIVFDVALAIPAHLSLSVSRRPSLRLVKTRPRFQNYLETINPRPNKLRTPTYFVSCA